MEQPADPARPRRLGLGGPAPENTGACDRALGEFTGDVGAWVDELTGAFLINTSRTEAVEGLHGNLDNTLKHIQEADRAKYAKAARAVRARVLAARDGK